MMYGSNDIYVYIQQMHQFVSKQNQRMNQMEQIIQQLSKELNELKQRPMTNIEKIEYKFDQLKVETLEGTLNIGLNPTDGEAIEDFAVSQGKLDVPNVRYSNNSITQDIQNEIYDFLADECYDLIEKIENEHHKSFDESYRDFIVDDIRRQIETRISFYVQQHQGELQHEARIPQVKERVISQIKHDIHQAIIAFIKNMPNDMKG
ncbi:spore germination protein GerPC [Bacillus timonensis]|nr:spore germination protein GerPC [Bacillus timonensis]